MILRLLHLWEGLRSSYWFVPGLLALMAFGLSIGMAKVDGLYSAEYASQLGWIYTGGPEGARGVLSAISSSVIGVAGTTFSITIAVLSLTSGQYGPRLLRGFMRDVGNQIVLGTFTATYLYCLLVLRTIRGTEETTYVPHFSVTVGVVLAILSVGVLIYFVHHVAESIQVSHIIDEVGRDCDHAVERLFPMEIGSPEHDAILPDTEPATICSNRIGYIESIDGDALLTLAKSHDLLIRIEVRPGEYILPETCLLSVWPSANGLERLAQNAFSLGRRRTTLQDAEFAFLQITEVAVRALSPGINDPFTAIQCLDRITASMCLLARRSWPASHRVDETGVLRLVVKPTTPAELVQAAYGYIREAAKDAPIVTQKLRAGLETLILRVEDPNLANALENERGAI